MGPFSITSLNPFSQAGICSEGIDPPKILLTNSKTNIIGIDGFGLKISGIKKLK